MLLVAVITVPAVVGVVPVVVAAVAFAKFIPKLCRLDVKLFSAASSSASDAELWLPEADTALVVPVASEDEPDASPVAAAPVVEAADVAFVCPVDVVCNCLVIN